MLLRSSDSGVVMVMMMMRRPLLLLLCFLLLPVASFSRIVSKDADHRHAHHEDAVATTTRPHIYYCRSPNMEDFTCWWHPLDNLTDGEQVTYILTYSKDKGPKHECPDYVTAGANSCHFDSTHTSIWKIYCMSVTAMTPHRNYTSHEHCLDVAEIVQTEAPVNLSFSLSDPGGDELGHNALLSWSYPVPSDLQYGWITLVYELQYRRVTEPDNWKVKHPLREPHVELLGLPVGDYVVRVRCRSRNYGLWSRWSVAMVMSIPPRPPAGKLLVLILLTGVGVVALLVITFGVIPQSKRIKDYFLPPIPKPRIIGLDPRLLKKGNLDEINHHFSNFHSYSPPSYSDEIWDQVSADEVCLTPQRDGGGGGGGHVDHGNHGDGEKDLIPPPVGLFPAPYVQGVAPYCSLPVPPHDAFTARPEIVTLPGSDYSVTISRHDNHHHPHQQQHQDFYTCVQLMNESGEVHLVPCLPPPPAPYCPPPHVSKVTVEKQEEEEEEEEEKKNKKMMKKKAIKDGGYSERSEAAVPLLAVDTKG